MPSTPLICSSIGVATVSAMTFGLAPGYCARTTTVGGATSGYSEIGSAGIDSNPPRKISIDKTPAKIGRSIKNFEKLMGRSRLWLRAAEELDCFVARAPRNDGERFLLSSPRHCERSE